VEAVELTRRAFLAALLGEAAALAACKRPPPTLSFAGELKGQSAAPGHLLRDGRVPPFTGEREQVGVLIVGGGPAGLSAAWRLKQQGFTDVRVLELEAWPGGTSAWGTEGPVPHPWGAHYVPVPGAHNTHLIRLLTELGAVEGLDAAGRPQIAEEQLCRAPQERLYFASQWNEGLYPRFGATARDLQQLRAFEAEVERHVGLRDGLGKRAFALPIASTGRVDEALALDQVSIAAWMKQRGYDSERLRWYVEYACRDDYGLSLEQTSAWAGLFYFAARVETAGEKAAEFITWPEGNGRLARHLAASAGDQLKLGVMVSDVRPGADAVEVDAYDVAASKPLGFRAQQVILAVPQFIGRRLLAPWRASPPAHLASFTYSSWLTAHLVLSRGPDERSFPLAWDNVLHGSRSLGYVSATHQAGMDHGKAAFTYYLPFPDGLPAKARQDLLAADWKHWADAVLADLARAHPDLPALVERLDVWRWGHAMVRPTVGLFTSGALEAARQPVGRVRFAHTDLSGLALFEEAQHWGVTAADGALASLRP
jgi:phytoene dehydrogenase-like protein